MDVSQLLLVVVDVDVDVDVVVVVVALQFVVVLPLLLFVVAVVVSRRPTALFVSHLTLRSPRVNASRQCVMYTTHDRLNNT